MTLSVTELSIGGVHTRYRVAEDGVDVGEARHTRESAIHSYLLYRPWLKATVAEQLQFDDAAYGRWLAGENNPLYGGAHA